MYKIRFVQFLAKKEVKSIEEKYNAAQLDNFEKIIKKAILIKMIKKKI